MSKKNHLGKLFFGRLHGELLLATAGSLAFAVLFFLMMQKLALLVTNNYLYDSNFMQQHIQRSMDSFQEYVTKQGLSTTDTEAIRAWADNRQPITFGIVSNDRVVFDVNDAVPDGYDSNIQEEQEDWAGGSYQNMLYNVDFADKQAQIFFDDFFDYKIYNISSNILVLVSLFLFLALFTLLIRNKIKYISRLDEGIHILENGDLKYEVPVSGYDELAHLAQSLNEMRTSLNRQIEAKEEAYTANRELITALSHDLRTPLTTQTGYLEILREGHYATREEHDRYVEKCLDTCRQVKDMTDRLFEYFMAFQKEEETVKCELEEYDAGELFLQFISENSFLLEEEGFRFEFDMLQEPLKVKANVDFLCRIFDNLFSNLRKYGEKSAPVFVTVEKRGRQVVVEMKNAVRKEPAKVESTKIGLSNVKSMMQQQGGSLETGLEGEDFKVCLSFPVVE